MHCPRCPQTGLRERDHEGIVVDYCPECRGLWLDRGELEKLVARSRDDDAAWDRPNRPARTESQYRHDDSPPDGYDVRDHDRHNTKRKKSWFSKLDDIFD